MYCLLSPYVALRSWRLVPYAYYIKHRRNAMGLKKEEFELLSLCDGQHDLEQNHLLDSLIAKRMAAPCHEGEALTEWQKPRLCDNRYFPAMNWMITGKCNYNCLHCFNAADNVRLSYEFTWEESRTLIAQAAECGINAITLTGGEPMLHPNFLDIIREIYARGMYVDELNTNGFFINQDLLDCMKEIGCVPLIKISFDGLGHHDWLRNRPGAESDALRAIRLCVANGFSVKAQTNVHRLNVTSMLPTAKLLDGMGVSEMRIIRTTEAPRWKQNAGDACLELTEYFDEMLCFSQQYTQTDCLMDIDIWQFLTIHPQLKIYRPRPIACSPDEYRDSIPVCRGNRGMVAITASGNLVPCHQVSGYYEQHNDVLGNVKTDGLKKHLQSGEYLCEVCTTLGKLKERNTECAACKVFKYCAGGCRAVALALTDDKFGKDLSKCVYFKKGYLQKTIQALKGYGCAVKIDEIV